MLCLYKNSNLGVDTGIYNKHENLILGQGIQCMNDREIVLKDDAVQK